MLRLYGRLMPPEARHTLRVCVIGAGCSGLVAAKALKERGIRATVFEMGSRVGGLWVFGNDNGRGGAYRSLRINTSRPMTEFSDFPMSPGLGDYPSHSQIAKYFADYAEHFELLPLIRFRTEVIRAVPVNGPSGGYSLTVRNLDTGVEEEIHADALVVANGHHFEPSIPRFPGLDSFQGEVVHSHNYIDPSSPAALAGRSVCVVGSGNSGVDIASEAALASARVSFAMRTPTWILPKYLFGKPIDQGTLIPDWLPSAMRRTIATWGVRLLVGKMSDFGLPDPTHRIGETHPTLSDTLPALVKSGQVRVRGALRELRGRAAYFDDELEPNPLEVDVLILGTGYRVQFPFFASNHISAPKNVLRLFGRVFHPRERHVFFVGLAQTVGAITKTAELQASWIAAHLAGTYNLPDEEEMKLLIAKDERETQRRYLASERHTMQVDPLEFKRFLLRELARGQARALAGQGVPFPNGGEQ